LDVQTLLIFVAIPALIVLVIGGLAYAFGGDGRTRRYRPGRPYDFAPVWFLSAPELLSGASDARALGTGSHRRALAAEVETGGPVPPASTGGASDRW
jgi:hypothetical protein